MGPYLMPHFDAKQIDQHELDSIARYVLWTRHPVQRRRLGDLQHRPDPRGDGRLVHGAGRAGDRRPADRRDDGMKRAPSMSAGRLQARRRAPAEVARACWSPLRAARPRRAASAPEPPPAGARVRRSTRRKRDGPGEPAGRDARRVLLLLGAAVFGFGFTAIYIVLVGATPSCSASRSAARCCCWPPAAIVAGKFVVPQETARRGARRAARRGADRGGRRDDRVRGRGHLAPGAADRRRRTGRRRVSSPPPPRRSRRSGPTAEPASTTRRGTAASAWSTTRRGPTSPPTSRSARSTPRCPRTAIRSRSGAGLLVVRLPPELIHLPRGAPRLGAARASSPTRRSARTPAARSRCTAIRRYAPTSADGRRSPARATTRRSCPARAVALVFGPAGRALPQLPLMIDADGYLRAAGRLPRGHRPLLVGRPPERVVNARRALRRTAGSCGPARALRPSSGVGAGRGDQVGAALRVPRPLVVPARRDRALLVHRPGRHRDLPDALLRPERLAGHLPRPLRAAAGRADVRGLPLGAEPQLQRPGRAAVPPGPPLGGRRVHRLDRAAPDADLLHRRLPQAARSELLHRADDADAGDPRGIRRLLAGRRPAVRNGPGDRLLGRAVDPVHRRPARLPGVGRPVPGLEHASSRGWRSSTCCSSRRRSRC